MSEPGQTMRRLCLEDAAIVKWGDTKTTKASYTPSGYLAYSATGPDGYMDHFDHEGPGIVLSAIGAQCGKTWFADGQWSCIKNTIYLKARPKVADTRFLYYATSMPDFWPRRGAAQPFISQGDARRCELLLPSLETQRRIASILGAYDDLIEVNRRRVAVLEEMARRLFAEWFVHFRFPGHQDVPLVDTPDGPLPEGWEWRQLGRLASLKSGDQKLTKKAYRSEGVRAYSASGPDGHVETATHVGPAVIVSAVGAYCGKTWLADGAWTTIANTFAVIPDGAVSATYLYFATYGIEKWPRRGAAQPFIAKTDAGTMKLPIASEKLHKQFDSLASALMHQGESFRQANVRLAASRDLLLPQLISGQLSVWKAEEDLETAQELEPAE